MALKEGKHDNITRRGARCLRNQEPGVNEVTRRGGGGEKSEGGSKSRSKSVAWAMGKTLKIKRSLWRNALVIYRNSGVTAVLGRENTWSEEYKGRRERLLRDSKWGLSAFGGGVSCDQKQARHGVRVARVNGKMMSLVNGVVIRVGRGVGCGTAMYVQ